MRLAERLPAGFADSQQMEAALTRQEAASLAPDGFRRPAGAAAEHRLWRDFFAPAASGRELPLPEATRGWPNTDEAAAISLVRWLVLLKCCGRQNSERAFYDPLLRDLLLIPPTLSRKRCAPGRRDSSRNICKVFSPLYANGSGPRCDRS